LRDEDEIGEAEVDCEGDHSGHKTCPYCSNEVGDITDEPDDEEGDGDALGGSLSVILDQLRNLLVDVVSRTALKCHSITAEMCYGAHDQIYRDLESDERHTSRKIHAANDTLPKTPLSAS
jgi:hypothetical protein